MATDDIVHIANGVENGYNFIFWHHYCSKNFKTNEPEYTYAKAIEGSDSFYIVQKAWKRKPSYDDVVKWTQYFKKIVVCDSRTPERKCPKVI